MILADTKFEFGTDAAGNLILIDEVLTPDSSRYWPRDSYEPGQLAAELRQAVCAGPPAGPRVGPEAAGAAAARRRDLRGPAEKYLAALRKLMAGGLATA